MSSRLNSLSSRHLKYFQIVPLLLLSLNISKSAYTHLYQLLESNECISCQLESADLSYSNLKNARLSLSDLQKAQLIYTNLSSADLTNTNLEDAILVGANLSKANMTGANLKDADLSYANLSGATISLSQIRSSNFINAIGLDYSIFEKGDLIFLASQYSSANDYLKVYKVLTVLLNKSDIDKSDILLQRGIALLYIGQINLALKDISNASKLLTDKNDPRSKKIDLILNDIQAIISQANEKNNVSGLGFKAFESINSLSSIGRNFVPSLLPLVRLLFLSI